MSAAPQLFWRGVQLVTQSLAGTVAVAVILFFLGLLCKQLPGNSFCELVVTLFVARVFSVFSCLLQTRCVVPFLLAIVFAFLLLL